jgi:TonB-dependent SusC/RagA subfamily outer membrane receptor
MDALGEAPGQIRIRSAEEKSPLHFIDGERQADDFDLDNDIDVNDIKAVHVLKDKSATDAYGPDGEHGVILITTKSGPGKSKKQAKEPVVAPAPVARPEPAVAPAPTPAVPAAPVPPPAPAPRYLTSTIYPNPSTGETQILFSLEAEEQVSFTIFDAAGREVRSRSFGRLPSGEQQLNFNMQDLPAGNYTIIVQAGTARWKGTVVRP